MEQIGGATTATRFHRRHHRKPAERFLGVPQSQPPSTSPPIELSEHDIFTTPSGCSPPPPPPQQDLNIHATSASRSIHGNQGILAALNSSVKGRSGSEHDARTVFNHKASLAASLSSSSSISASPATPISYRMMIPRPPPMRADRERVYHQSAPVNIPVIPEALRRRARELADAVSEEEEEEEDGVRLPPHEVVDSRHSPMLACSVLEGAGRTLKGRDLRQVRNAIWRKTGFVD